MLAESNIVGTFINGTIFEPGHSNIVFKKEKPASAEIKTRLFISKSIGSPPGGNSVGIAFKLLENINHLINKVTLTCNSVCSSSVSVLK